MNPKTKDTLYMIRDNLLEGFFIGLYDFVKIVQALLAGAFAIFCALIALGVPATILYLIYQGLRHL